MTTHLRSLVARGCLAACGASALLVVLYVPPVGADQKAAAIPEAAVKEAKEIFSTRCFTCHGLEGKGDGPASAGLDPKPRNFSDPAWQKSVTDEHIEKIVVLGGAGVGKSPMMPPNPDLNGKTDVVKALRAYVRELGEQTSAKH